MQFTLPSVPCDIVGAPALAGATPIAPFPAALTGPVPPAPPMAFADVLADAAMPGLPPVVALPVVPPVVRAAGEIAPPLDMTAVSTVPLPVHSRNRGVTGDPPVVVPSPMLAMPDLVAASASEPVEPDSAEQSVPGEDKPPEPATTDHRAAPDLAAAIASGLPMLVPQQSAPIAPQILNAESAGAGPASSGVTDRGVSLPGTTVSHGTSADAVAVPGATLPAGRPRATDAKIPARRASPRPAERETPQPHAQSLPSMQLPAVGTTPTDRVQPTPSATPDIPRGTVRAELSSVGAPMTARAPLAERRAAPVATLDECVSLSPRGAQGASSSAPDLDSTKVVPLAAPLAADASASPMPMAGRHVVDAPVERGDTPAAVKPNEPPADTRSPDLGQTSAAQLTRVESAAPTGDVEKFAVTVPAVMRRVQVTAEPPAKSMLVPVPRPIAKVGATLGTAVAKPPATMPSDAPVVRLSAPDAAPVTEIAMATSVHNPREVQTPMVESASATHRAVEAVLSMTDRLAARGQHSVTLQFTVGGDPLSVRVDLRAGEVHTTFRTDSLELRTALANEWQAVAQQPTAERPLRLAEPVFTSTDTSGSSGTGGEASRQQQHQQPAMRADFAAEGRSVAPRSIAAKAGAGVPASSSPARLVPSSSIHLHTVA